MTGKKFLFYGLLGVTLLLSPLPLFNYYVDQYRVLNHDYWGYYKEPNKNFLKMHYLLNNEHNFTKFIFGSSRVKAIDTRLLGDEWYNMTYSFGIPATHLYNLKLLIKNKVKIEEIVVGINDADIWKKPEDFENDYLRRNYPDSLIEKIDFYKDYLFKRPTQRDVKIFNKKLPLIVSENHIIRPIDFENIKKEKLALKQPTQHSKKIEEEHAKLLGYTKKDYRIEKTLDEIEEIIKICQQNSIKYKFIFLPVHEKVLQLYDKSKINHFKIELKKMTPVLDFYVSGKITKKNIFWRDTSHLFPSPTNKFITKRLK